MKRIILSLALICALSLSIVVGFKGVSHTDGVKIIPTKEDLNKTENQPKEKQSTAIDESNDIEIIENFDKEVLSPEDVAVNEEIAKYNASAEVFTKIKREKIGNKEYALTFEKVGFSSVDGDESQRITYKTSVDDYFIYDAKTGKLESVLLTSNYAPKTDSSIDIEFAKKIAYNTASQMCEMSKYVLYESKEVFDGYVFKYGKYVGDYRTAEGVNVTVAFNGEISNIGLWTDIFDGIELDIDENWINLKLQEAVSDHNNLITVTDKWISVEENKPCLMVVLSNNLVYTFPFEN